MKRGISKINWYEFSTKTIEEFEKSFIEWASENSEKESLIFDYSNMEDVVNILQKTSGESQCSNDFERNVSIIRTENYEISWYTLAGGLKCILMSVKSNDGTEIYREPSHFADTVIGYWY